MDEDKTCHNVQT